MLFTLWNLFISTNSSYYVSLSLAEWWQTCNWPYLPTCLVCHCSFWLCCITMLRSTTRRSRNKVCQCVWKGEWRLSIEMLASLLVVSVPWLSNWGIAVKLRVFDNYEESSYVPYISSTLSRKLDSCRTVWYLLNPVHLLFPQIGRCSHLHGSNIPLPSLLSRDKCLCMIAQSCSFSNKICELYLHYSFT